MEDELVQGDALATGLRNSCASRFGKAQSSNSELGNFINSLVISHSSNDYGGALAKKSKNALSTYVLVPRCLINLESETGALFVRDETSRRRTVFENPDPVLRDRNLKSLTSK